MSIGVSSSPWYFYPVLVRCGGTFVLGKALGEGCAAETLFSTSDRVLMHTSCQKQHGTFASKPLVVLDATGQSRPKQLATETLLSTFGK
eukprot:1583661-Amphidinium_carterae.1